jgi:hypothetical protein
VPLVVKDFLRIAPWLYTQGYTVGRDLTHDDTQKGETIGSEEFSLDNILTAVHTWGYTVQRNITHTLYFKSLPKYSNGSRFK